MGWLNVVQVRTAFAEVNVDGLRRWIHDAHEQLAGSVVVIYEMAGNDDPFVIDETFRAEGGDRVPPYNSRLDTAPRLHQDLKAKRRRWPDHCVGSLHAVQAATAEYEPLLTLHGHIHKSGGTVRSGRTTTINAGSEYGEGVLRGVLLLTVGDGRLLRHQHVSG